MKEARIGKIVFNKSLANDLSVAVLILLLALLPILGHQLESWSNYADASSDTYFEEGWKIRVNGDEKDLSFPFKLDKNTTEAVLINTLPNVMDDTDLVLYHQKQWVKVEIDGSVVYEMEAPMLGNLKTIVGSDIVSIPMYTRYAGKQIKIYLTQFDNGKNMFIKHMRITTRYGVLASLIKDNILKLCLILCMVVGAVVCIIASVIARRSIKSVDARMSSLFLDIAVLYLSGCMWMLTDRSILGVLTGKMVTCGVMIYYFYTLLPICAISVIMGILNKDYLYMQIFKHIFILELVVQAVLYYYGVVDLPNVLPLTNTLIAVFMIAIVIHFLIYMAKDKHRDNRLVYISASIAAVMIIFSIISYTMDLEVDYMTVVFLGMVFFEICLLMYVMKQFRSRLTDLKRLKENERIANLDVLTGFGNRRAFEMDVVAAREKAEPDKDALIIIMELKGLIEVNDSEGRAGGDRYIVAAANCILECFSKVGSCYRISGDAFAVICPSWDGNYMALKSEFNSILEKKKEELGREIILISGLSHLLDDTNTQKTVESWVRDAEVNMYIYKADNTRVHVSDNSNLKNAIESIITHSENKLYGMQGHSDTVKEISVYIASKMSLRPEQVEPLALAAKYHDVGIIGVPDYLLSRKDKLTDAEFEIIKKHPEIGDSIFAYAPGMQKVAGIVRSHHERFDGMGYPDKLKGNNIPVESRIIAIADSIDSMLSPRTYRKTYDFEGCKRELERYSGSMYDSGIIVTVLNNWDGIEEIMRNKEKKLKICESAGEY